MGDYPTTTANCARVSFRVLVHGVATALDITPASLGADQVDLEPPDVNC